jgi:integrase
MQTTYRLYAQCPGKNDREYREAPLSRQAYRLLMQWIVRRPVVSEYEFTSFGGRGQRASAAPLSTVTCGVRCRGMPTR